MIPIRTIQVSPFIDMSGANRAMVTHVEEIAKRGPTVAFVLVEGPMADECRRVGATVVTAFGHSGLPKNRMKRFSGVISTINRAVRQHDIQLIHSHSAMGAHYCLPASLMTGVPWVSHQRQEYDGGWVHVGQGAAAHLFAVSGYVKSTLPPKWQAKCTVAYDATEIPDMQPQPEAPNGIMRVGMAAACGWNKGHDLAVEAAAMLLDKHDFTMQIWGLIEDQNHPGWKWSKTVRDKVAALPPHIQKHFTIHGFRLDMENYYNSIDISMVPSRYHDAFPRMMNEPMARYKPVIVAYAGGMMEFVEHEKSGLHHKMDDAKDLAAQLERLLNDADLRARLRVGGRARVEQLLRAKEYGDLIESKYREVLANR